ncbi:hypothetical protein [Sphingobacterium wenxiniae]|uniref:Cytochrome C and Quinol oxidase polypeptide I n=1 Tax=Sphingobacterium wenxiniae TaxID=683125 RepID=A0A1I6T1E2_9SPHI|nr:hypothetical protein [Sphingobacterium wenxiniae]SFS83094.1 hypothetical protein SAMN05660206_105206 [Sphingobacterium wenxiniae]
MADIFVNKAPKEYVVVPFFGTAALFFLLLCLLLCFSAKEITGHYFNPHILAIVHTAALGWGTMVIMGAAYQLLPVICENELVSPRMAFLSYLFLTIGTCILVYCFWTFRTDWLMMVAGSSIVLSSYFYAYIIYRTATDANKSPIYQYFLLISALWLCFTTTVGILLVINLSYTFIPRNHIDVLKLHAHAGIVGWFLLLICGVGAKLIPMFLLGKSKKTILLYVALILQNLGLILFLVDGYFNPMGGRMLIYGALIALGTICWLIYLADTYQHRARKKVDVPMRHAAFSIGSKILAFGMIPVILLNPQTKWIALYGTLIFLGWITALILGKTFKTLPFIVWNQRYKNLNGKLKIPMPKQLYSEEVVKIQYYLYSIAIVLLCLGIALDSSLLLQYTGILWVLVAVLYVYNVFRIIFHKTTLHHENSTN